MSYVITFEDFRPGARYDNLPWTRVQIEEAAAADGTWTVIDTITLTPVDNDPSQPVARNFTTEHATLADGWYRITFLDASGDLQVLEPFEHSQTVRYFTVSEFRARYPDLTEDQYSDALIEQYRQLAEEAFEDACQRAFVPRTATETSTDVRVASHITPYQDYFQGGVRSHPRTLNHRDVRAVTAITAATGTDTVTVDQVTVTNGWLDGLAVGTYTITYTYGADTPPLRVKQAVMSLAREWMLSGPVTDRQTGIPVEGGGFISLALPGRFGTTGLPEVDETIAQYRFVSFVG